jgi:peptidoglycan/xylan/chitin deacetylase (PgdA/CDA1 family)
VKLSRRDLFKASAVLGAGALDLISTPFAQAATNDIQHGSRSKQQVALTFHGAGAPDYSEELLKLFKSTSTPVTVFAVGTWLKSDATIGKRIIEAGHDLGNHTLSHTQMKTISAARVDSEIAGCAAELKKQIGNHGAFFRPSGTQFSTATIRKAAVKYGYGQCISYEVDSEDFKDPSKAKVISNVINNVQNGSIISMHFGHKVTLQAMPELLDKLHAKGFTPVTVSELLKA